MVKTPPINGPNSRSDVKRFTLQATLGTMMVSLLVLLGTAIVLFTMHSQKKSILESTGNVFNYAAIQTKEKLMSLTNPVETFVELSAHLDRLGIEDRGKFLNFLPYMFQSLTSTPWISSVYIGYENGDFFMLQSLEQGGTPQAEAPGAAVFFLKQIVTVEGGGPEVTFFYFDSELNLLLEERKPFQGFDPRARPWYSKAIESDSTVLTPPYVYFTTGMVGITAARRLSGGNGVVGADSTLQDLLVSLQANKLTPDTEIVVFDGKSVLLTTTNGKAIKNSSAEPSDGRTLDIPLDGLESGIMPAVAQRFSVFGAPYTDEVQGVDDRWFVHLTSIAEPGEQEIYLVLASPYRELMVQARKMITSSIIIVLVALFLAILAALFLAGKISFPLQGLSTSAEEIRNFRLKDPITIKSRITEVNNLAASMSVMQSAINQFVDIARALSAEKDMDRVLEMILAEIKTITKADGGGIGLVSDDGQQLGYVLVENQKRGVHKGGGSGQPLDLVADLGGEGEQVSIESQVVESRSTMVLQDITSESRYDFSAITKAHEGDGYSVRSVLLIPLLNRQEEVLGVLSLVNCRDSRSGELVDFSSHRVSYVEALSSNAALALDNNRLLKAQKDLFDAFVKLLAGAIDTKSPYTGGHCQRVPIISAMLAGAAQQSEKTVFKDFNLSADEEHELYLASWLHDCGKVTTPEYVVDKATKLETIYDRIHEVRMRFEVLLRDAELAYYRQLQNSPEKEGELKQQLEERRLALGEDFTFVARCNIGGEYLDPERVDRLREIGTQTWDRHFDNRLGIAHEALQRYSGLPDPLPVAEKLLDDKPEHIVPRHSPVGAELQGGVQFCMQVPEHAFNLGELYNLSIGRGTLTDEERYAINDHIVQTILMLKRLPFPKEMRRVPEWAGNHHEKLDGTGYPRCLKADELSLPERIMAVADIFEALTAADRPYKEPKKLSDCLRIMSFMSKDGHICSDLFTLLLTSGVYLDYAKQYMQPGQIDEVNIQDYLAAG